MSLQDAIDFLGTPEAEHELSRRMTDHVYSHENSNSPLSFACSGPCASSAALMIVQGMLRPLLAYGKGEGH